VTPGRSRILLALLLALACANDAPWWREGATAADLESDRAECLRESGSTAPVMNYTTSRFLERCLRERGWTRGGPAASATAKPPAPARSESAPDVAPTASPPTASPRPDLSFDECFARCRELTDRTREQCFDVCLAAP